MMKTKIFNYFLLSVVVLFLSSCSKTREFSYKEEVRLSNGEIVIVKRTFEVFFGVDSWFRPSFSRTNEQFEILDKNSSTQYPIWHSYQDNVYATPILLDKNKNGDWFIVVAYDNCDNWNSDFAYRQYKVVNGNWQRMKFDKDLISLNSNLANLDHNDFEYVSYINENDKYLIGHSLKITKSGKISRDLITLKEKEENNGNNQIAVASNPRYNKIHTIRKLQQLRYTCKSADLTENQVKEQEQWLPDGYIPISTTRETDKTTGERFTYFYYSENWGDTIAKNWAGKAISREKSESGQPLVFLIDEQGRPLTEINQEQ
ncbi:MAG: hypothetical protein IKG79_05165 [Neisseriaceae bacterium]|nr:hypothetical protein [Neisseriaceae bacterium]